MVEQKRFVLLDGMRGFAALGVLAFHAVVVTDYMYIDSWYLLVDFFFVLSGFVLQPSMPASFKGFGRSSIKFILNRILRFWPMLIAVLGVTWIIYRIRQSDPDVWPDPNFTDGMFIQAFFLLQIFNAAVIAMNWPLWSLSAEWFGNLAYTPLTAVKRNIGIGIGILVGYVALAYGLNTDKQFIGDSWSFGSGPIAHWEAWGRMMIEFGFGLLARKYLAQLSKFRNWLWLTVSILLTAALFWSHSYFQGDTVYFTTYFAGPVFALLVLQASRFNPDPNRWLGASLTWLGKMSFGIYAFHVVVLINFDQIVPWPMRPELPNDPTWAWFLINKIWIAAFIAIVLAHWTNRIVEKPIQWLGKRALKRL